MLHVLHISHIYEVKDIPFFTLCGWPSIFNKKQCAEERRSYGLVSLASHIFRACGDSHLRFFVISTRAKYRAGPRDYLWI